MKKKKIIISLAAICAILVVAGILIYINRYAIMRQYYKMENKSKGDRYLYMLDKNSKDFEYIINTMKQWPNSTIYFDDYGESYPGYIYFDDYLSSNNEEVISELSNNKEFYGHVMKIYKTNGFYEIHMGGDSVAFGLRNPPRNGHGELIYYYEALEVRSSRLEVIDEHWAFRIMPNI